MYQIIARKPSCCYGAEEIEIRSINAKIMSVNFFISSFQRYYIY